VGGQALYAIGVLTGLVTTQLGVAFIVAATADELELRSVCGNLGDNDTIARATAERPRRGHSSVRILGGRQVP